jgi:hypothetical protein
MGLPIRLSIACLAGFSNYHHRGWESIFACILYLCSYVSLKFKLLNLYLIIKNEVGEVVEEVKYKINLI